VCVVGISLIVKFKAEIQSQPIPFGPYLAARWLLTLLYGNGLSVNICIDCANEDFVVGLSGGIGSGKTTVLSDFLPVLVWILFDADVYCQRCRRRPGMVGG